MSEGGPNGLLVVGDNLHSMPVLLGRFEKRCKLVLVDPPYNAKNRKDYPDEMGHDEWLSWLEERLRLACRFLTDDGILAAHIDDSEQAYLQILLDRILGRARRLNTVCVKMSELSGVKMRYQDRMLPRTKEYVLLYGATDSARLKPLRRPKTPEKLAEYADYYRWYLDNPDAPVENWQVRPVREAMKSLGIARTRESLAKFRLDHAHRMVYRTNNKGFDQLPPDQRPITAFAKLKSPWGEEYVWWEGKQMLFLSDYLEEPLADIWTDISTINLGREGAVSLRSGKKPEALMERIVELSTNPGDLVFDPFCGSGTTSAVAHKCGRDWITLEIDENIALRAKTRMDSVVAGTDPFGITATRGWDGGGRFEMESIEETNPCANLPGVSHLSEHHE